MNTISTLDGSGLCDVEKNIVKTTCPYCGVGCGVSVELQPHAQGHKIQISGDAEHPANFGRLCIKGSRLADTLGLETRILQPMLGRQDQRELTTWDTAIETIADQLQSCIDQYGRDSIAFYVSGQLLTEDYYVVNKFVKGYLGTANIDTNSRLCMSSAVAAHKRSFGEDIVPASYEDFEHADMVVLVGSNTAWCHPVLYQRIMHAKSQNPNLFIVVIDPRFTSTCEQADLHLPILLGQDVALFNGLVQYLYQNGFTDTDFVDRYTQGLEQLLLASQSEASFEHVVARTGISADKLGLFFDKFANTAKVVTLFSMGVNQSSQGVNKANSIINCHLLSGKIGKLGAAPFSMTGQPNAMGGREVGGLANMLAAHMDLDNPNHQALVQAFWDSPYIAQQAGLKAIDLFHAVESGQIKAIWIMATNPVVSLPDAEQVKRALLRCPFVVVSDICANTDTTVYADILLPALGWGEKEGTVTNSERCISRQRAFLAAPAQAKSDWWAVCQVAKKLGFSGFDFDSAHEIFQEHAALSAYRNTTLARREQTESFRYFNLKGLMHLSSVQYQQLPPIQWPVWDKDQDTRLIKQLFRHGHFSHADQRAKMIPTLAIDPVHPISAEYPLRLNTGRIRDQWHTMTRTGLSSQLATHRAEPYCEVHPQDALIYGLKDKQLVEVKSAWGRCVLRTQFSEDIRRGQIFVPIHWSDQVASDARIGKVVNPIVDEISGEPEFKHTPVQVQPFYTQWQGVFYIRNEFAKDIQANIETCIWWTKIITQHAIRYELSGLKALDFFRDTLKAQLSAYDESFEWLHFEDMSSQLSHSILLKNNLLIASLYIAPPELLPDRDWIASLFLRERLSALHRKALLAGMPMMSTNHAGPMVCSCFKVGKNQIIDVIRAQHMTDEKQVTACLKAGGNCGSCLPEIRGLIKACQLEVMPT